MRVMVVAGFTALLMATSSPALAQQAASSSVELPREADLKVFTDVRVELVKGALQLKPDQTKLWPAVEEAIRTRATVRRARLAKLAAMRNSEREPDPIEIMHQRAELLTQKGTALKKLADAWQPLYQTLDDQQKLRLGVLVVYGLRVVANSFEEEDEDE
jgi:hypothetical protein